MRVGNRFAPAPSAVAGRGTSRLPPWPWAVAGLALEVFPCRMLSRRRSTLMTFASSSERSRLRWSPPQPGEPGLGSSSPGLTRLVPLRRLPPARPLPDRRREALPFGPVVPSADLVPPSWFLTTSTVYSAQGLRVCCTPLPALGFIAFLATRSRRFRRSRGRRGAIPAMWARTLRRVPLASSRTASLRPLPSYRCRAALPRQLALPAGPRGAWRPCPEGRDWDAPEGVFGTPRGACTDEGVALW